MDENEKMREAIRKTFEAMSGQTGEIKSDFDKLQTLQHAIISNLGEFRREPEPEIVPAEPLTEPLEVEQFYYYSLGGTISVSRWDNDEMDHYRLKEKMIFPDSLEGKAGAELRAKVPHPGIHWIDDLRKLAEAKQIWGYSKMGDQKSEEDLAAAVDDFLDKYLNDK